MQCQVTRETIKNSEEEEMQRIYVAICQFLLVGTQNMSSILKISYVFFLDAIKRAPEIIKWTPTKNTFWAPKTNTFWAPENCSSPFLIMVMPIFFSKIFLNDQEYPLHMTILFLLFFFIYKHRQFEFDENAMTSQYYSFHGISIFVLKNST